jgi:branched-chain amino acid transport system ATP-binding protein
VAASPTYLLLDEPGAGLDDAESIELAETIARLRGELGCGVLLVEHDMRIIFKVCEQIQVLDYGKTIAVGKPQEIRSNRAVVAAYLGQKGAQVAQAE